MATPTPSTDFATSPRYKWFVVGMLWFICFFNYADRQAIFSIFPLLTNEFGFDKEQLGLIGSAFTIIYAVTAPIAGQVGDHWARKTVILGGLYIWSVITGFTAACVKVWHFVLVRGAEGLGETFYFPASMSLMSDYHSTRTRSRAMSIHQTSVYAGTIGGGALAGWMGQEFGWRSPFILLAVLGCILGVVLGAFIREPIRDQAQRLEVNDSVASDGPASPLPLGDYVKQILTTPSALCLLGAFAAANSVGVTFLVWMPTFLYDRFGLSVAKAGVYATIFPQVAMMVGSVIGGVAADRFGHHSPAGRSGVQAIGMLLGAPFIVACGWVGEMRYLIPAMIGFGLCKGIYDANIWPSLYDVVHPSRRGTTLGLGNFLGWGAAAVVSYFVGRLTARTQIPMGDLIAATAGFYVLGGLLLLLTSLLFVRRDIRRSRVEGAAAYREVLSH